MDIMRQRVVERFLAYVRVDTTSDEGSRHRPSSPGQMALALHLMDELRDLGLVDISRDHRGRVFASLPSNLPEGRTAPVIGLITHMDTSPEVSGKHVTPLVHHYTGGDIQLPAGGTISVADTPRLAEFEGDDIITSDGSTLLGADDKAGIAEVLTAIEHLVHHPDIPRGTVRVAFTTDEEIGEGTDGFDVEGFGADLAYTVDGGPLGQLELETFNAAEATFTITGFNLHPGYAKGRMKNALLIAAELIALFPPGERPSTTEGRDGFFHITRVEGKVEEARVKLIVRDFDVERFEERKWQLAVYADQLNQLHGEGTVALTVADSYRNMREVLDEHPQATSLAERAMREADVEPNLVPVRGGTDGARLSFMGPPTPNLFDGGHNFHSRMEFVPVKSMVKACEVLVNIVRLAIDVQTETLK
ncbi:MAG: peptidase T [Candidatus Undinarchaeales archaeon]|jgi:tripeptide aminopeptidase|nr:peptidase T [Candidatus Undinarchaeales archaeon]MDP7492220.1 peptidase T [Candidatus Undinarchaeales archaeon]